MDGKVTRSGKEMLPSSEKIPKPTPPPLHQEKNQTKHPHKRTSYIVLSSFFFAFLSCAALVRDLFGLQSSSLLLAGVTRA